MSFTQGVRKWISTSEASERDLPLPEHRLPSDWDENDIVVDEDIAPASSSPSKKGTKPAAPITASSATKSKKQQQQQQQQDDIENPGSPGNFPEGFFASPKNKKSSEFLVAATAKFDQKEEDARLKTNAAPGFLAALTGFFMPVKDGSQKKPSSSSAKPAAAAGSASASPIKRLTGARRDREESSSSSSSSESERGETETSGGDLTTRLSSFTAKQLESKVTVEELKEFARENDIKFTAKSKKGDLIELCKAFVKKGGGSAAAAAGAASPAATGASPRASSAAKKGAAVEASPVAAPKKVSRKPPTDTQFQAIPPVSVDMKGEPQPGWAVTQMKEWAKSNKVDLKDNILKRDIYQVCIEAYDAKH